MLISVFNHEYDIQIPAHILDKIGEEAVQQVIHYLVLYATEEGNANRADSVRRFMQQVVDYTRPIFPHMGQEQTDGQRAFGHTAFINTAGWDQHSLGKLCRDLAQALIDVLPDSMINHKAPRDVTATAEQPTL